MCYWEKKRLPIGIEEFEEICTDEYYYVDKTGMIREFLRRRGKVNLFTRPRRFGKTLNMSMLKNFFGLGCDKSIFEGLAVAEDTALCEKYMGKFPVISVSLKSAAGRYEGDYKVRHSLPWEGLQGRVRDGVKRSRQKLELFIEKPPQNFGRAAGWIFLF